MIILMSETDFNVYLSVLFQTKRHYYLSIKRSKFIKKDDEIKYWNKSSEKLKEGIIDGAFETLSPFMKQDFATSSFS